MTNFKNLEVKKNKPISLSKPIIGDEEIKAVVTTLKS
jgi:hypothetical protein